MTTAFFLAFRELLEAALVVGIVVTLLLRLGKTALVPSAWWGAGLGGGAALIIGSVIFFTIGELPESVEPLAEGVLMLIAGALATYMLWWFSRQTSKTAEIHKHTTTHATDGARLGIGLLTFLGVFREGVELAIFLLAAGQTDRAAALATLAGGVAALVFAYLFFAGLATTSFRFCLRITNFLLLIFAAGIMAHGVHELQEIGWLAFGKSTAFDISAIFSDKTFPGDLLRSLFGYNDNPTWLELGTYLGYLGIVGSYLFTTREQK